MLFDLRLQLTRKFSNQTCQLISKSTVARLQELQLFTRITAFSRWHSDRDMKLDRAPPSKITVSVIGVLLNFGAHTFLNSREMNSNLIVLLTLNELRENSIREFDTRTMNSSELQQVVRSSLGIPEYQHVTGIS